MIAIEIHNAEKIADVGLAMLLPETTFRRSALFWCRRSRLLVAQAMAGQENVVYA